MKITLSYTGGTYRGKQLARQFERLGYLHEFHTLSYQNRPGATAIDRRRVRTSRVRARLWELWWRMVRYRRLPPATQRYAICELVDRWVAQTLRPGADFLIVEHLIGLHTLRRAKQLGMITVLDRTNSHILNHSEQWNFEHAQYGIRWKPNSQRVIRKSLREYEEADYILVLSSFAERTFLERGVPANKVLLVPSGIDLTPFRQIEKTDTTFRVIYCGSLSYKKGTHYLLQAFSELNLKDAELWLIGSASDEIAPILEKYKGCYKLLGWLPNAELYKYYSQGSVYVQPSIEEGLAKVIIEAMACGLPVIATTNTGGEDVTREGVDGFIIPIRDVPALKEKILYLYENQGLCRQMGQNAKTRVRAGFTLEKYVQRLLCALGRILGDDS